MGVGIIDCGLFVCVYYGRVLIIWCLVLSIRVSCLFLFGGLIVVLFGCFVLWMIVGWYLHSLGLLLMYFYGYCVMLCTGLNLVLGYVWL